MCNSWEAFVFPTCVINAITGLQCLSSICAIKTLFSRPKGICNQTKPTKTCLFVLHSYCLLHSNATNLLKHLNISRLFHFTGSGWLVPPDRPAVNNRSATPDPGTSLADMTRNADTWRDNQPHQDPIEMALWNMNEWTLSNLCLRIPALQYKNSDCILNETHCNDNYTDQPVTHGYKCFGYVVPTGTVMQIWNTGVWGYSLKMNGLTISMCQ